MSETLWETLRNRDNFLLKASLAAASLFALVVGPKACEFVSNADKIECSDQNAQIVSEIADRNPYPIGEGALIHLPVSCE
jgi:hypothetical protein